MRTAPGIPLLALVLVGCVSIVPGSSTGSIAPTVSAVAETLAPTASPLTSTASPLAPTASPAATETPVAATVVPTPAPTSAPPARTPRPTQRPTPTPAPIAVDLSTFIFGADLPNPWYTNTTYTIPFYVEVTGADVPNSRVKVAIVLEGFAESFNTGPIAPGDNYSHNVDFNLEAMGPATLTWSVKAPRGYYDTDMSNNKASFDIQVLPKP